MQIFSDLLILFCTEEQFRLIFKTVPGLMCTKQPVIYSSINKIIERNRSLEFLISTILAMQELKTQMS